MSGIRPKAKFYITGKKPGRRRRIVIAAAAVMLICGGGLYWLWHSGWPQQQAERLADAGLQMTAQAGFSLEEISVEGRQYTDKAAVMAALQAKRGMPIMAIDPASMLERLQALPWLSSAMVERRLPHTLYIRLIERQPVARWQYRNQIQVIDMDGKTLPARADDFARLPLIVGEGAAERAVDLLAELAAYPNLQKQLHAAVHVGNRRWDLALESGITIRLPEANEASGLKRLAALMDDHEILSRDIVAIDLRQNDRQIIERSPGSEKDKPAISVPKI
ncbi:MAG: cell division protein FtsQ/DivIB [Alphaproteobacteria bacterium]